MNLDLRSQFEKLSNNWVEWKINSLMNQIAVECKFKGNTLTDLLSFKLTKWHEVTLQNSIEFKDALIAEIEAKARLWEIVFNNQENLSNAKYEVLASKIININQLKNEIQVWIQDLRFELSGDLVNLSASWMSTNKFYSPETLARINNPQNFKDNLKWLLVSAIELWVVLWKLSYDVWKWIVLSPYHSVQIIRWKAKYDWSVEI